MKKIFAVLMACLCVCSMSVFAADTSDPETQKHSTELSYTVDETYKWQVPANITFETNKNGADEVAKTGEVKVTENVIYGGKKLEIRVAGDHAFKIKSAEDIYRDYKVTGDTAGELAAGGLVLSVNAGTNTGTENLTFELQSVLVQQAGVYEGTMAFTAGTVAQ